MKKLPPASFEGALVRFYLELFQKPFPMYFISSLFEILFPMFLCVQALAQEQSTAKRGLVDRSAANYTKSKQSRATN